MMNWPLTIKQINSNIRVDELEGERSLNGGNTGFVHSDLVTGFRNGHLILLDEVTKSILIRQQNFTCPLNVSPGHSVLMVVRL